MIAAFNSLPRTADTTEGFFSRWVVVPFTAFFPAGRADPMLIGRLTSQANLQGLLRASVAGLQQAMRRGSFRLPASVSGATARFKVEADPVRGFMAERVRLGAPRFTGRTSIYTAYTVYANLNGFAQLSAQRFYEAFEAAAVDSIAGKPEQTVRACTRDGVRGFRGVELI